MKKLIFKIGIIGPRSFGLGGHDADNEVRKLLRGKFKEILDNEIKTNHQVIGITGLDIGTEQDFAQVCKDNGIRYICYLACSGEAEHWAHLPNAKYLYLELVEKANDSIVLHEGGYSPKKTIVKQKKIIDVSDIVIFVKNPLKLGGCDLLAYATSKNKNIIHLDPQLQLNYAF